MCPESESNTKTFLIIIVLYLVNYILYNEHPRMKQNSPQIISIGY